MERLRLVRVVNLFYPGQVGDPQARLMATTLFSMGWRKISTTRLQFTSRLLAIGKELRRWKPNIQKTCQIFPSYPH